MVNLEKRVDALENALTFFVVQTGAALLRLEKMVEEMKEQSAADQRAYLQRHETERQADLKRFAEWQQQTEAWQQRTEAWQQQIETWQQQLVAERQADQQRLLEWQEESKKDRQEYNKRWGELSNKLGTIVEDIVAPNIPRIASEHFGCGELQDFMVRRWVRNKLDSTKRREFDVIAVYEKHVVINETKSSVRIDYINDFIKVLPELTDYFPEYHGKQIIPIFASLYLGEDMVNYLTKQNIYAMAMGDETMDLLNVKEVLKTAQ